jgi:hypothetical protein
VQNTNLGHLESQRNNTIAEALGVTERTVQRDWDKARGILIAVLITTGPTRSPLIRASHDSPLVVDTLECERN